MRPRTAPAPTIWSCIRPGQGSPIPSPGCAPPPPCTPRDRLIDPAAQEAGLGQPARIRQGCGDHRPACAGRATAGHHLPVRARLRRRAADRRGLRSARAALSGQTARIVITTLQKFPFVLDKVAGPGQQAVRDRHRRGALVPIRRQVHPRRSSGRSGGWAATMRPRGDPLTASALARGRHPNLSYFAFTATPKNKTLQLFGRKNPETGDWEPFHTYAMRQAIEEGFILDVLRNYLTYQTYWRLRNAAVEEASARSTRARPRRSWSGPRSFIPSLAGAAGADHRRPFPRARDGQAGRARQGDGGDPFAGARRSGCTRRSGLHREARVH